MILLLKCVRKNRGIYGGLDGIFWVKEIFVDGGIIDDVEGMLFFFAFSCGIMYDGFTEVFANFREVLY